MTVEFGVLGSVEAGMDGRPVALGHTRQRGVLAVLLVDVNRLVTTDQLMDRVWGDAPPRRARTTLHSYLSRLRQALAATKGAVIARQPGGYVLSTDSTVTVDLHSFRRLVAQARATDDDAQASVLYEQALQLWRAEPFATLDTPWINALRDTLVQEQVAAQLDLGDVRLRLGQHATLLPELSARAEAHPLDERLAGQLMLALHRCGRSAEALDHFHHTRGRLARDLGIDPSPALRDVQAAVLRQDSAPAPLPATLAVPREVPAQLPLGVAAFTGRDSELAQLDALLPAPTDAGPVPSPAVVISAVSGTAGVGKTALAVHWAHRIREDFPDGQLYVNLRGFDPGGSVVAPADAVRGFLDALGVPPARIPNGLEAQAGLYRSLLAGRRLLVLLDNARDAEQVRPLLPGAPGCLALVTSRNRLTSLAATEGAQLLTVDLLTTTQARALLSGRLGADRTAAEPAAVDAIVTRCAGLPLALAIMAARAASQPRLPLTALARELDEADSRLDVLDAGDAAGQVRAVFATSYQALSTDAARLFRLLGLHPGPDTALPAAASLGGLPPVRAGALLTELIRGNLLTEHTPGRYALHDLLRVYATELVTTQDSDDTRRSAVHRMLDHYLHTAHAADALLTRRGDPISLAAAQPGAVAEELSDRREALAWLTAEHPVVLATIEQTPAGFETHTWQLATVVATFLNRQGRWPALAAAHEAALKAARRHNDKTGLANAHRGLALAQTQLNHADDARTHYAIALDLFRELGDHTGQARVHKHFGRMASDRDEYRKALGHARQAFAHYKAAHNRLGQADALNHIGRNLVRLGDHRHRALSCSRRALALVEEIGDLNGQARAWRSLGYIHHHLGQYGQAIDCYGHAIDLVRKTDDRYHEATGLADLGDTHHAAADPTAAHHAWTQALAITDEIGLPDTAPLRTKLLSHLDGRMVEALPIQGVSNICPRPTRHIGVRSGSPLLYARTHPTDRETDI
ncbi:BTAD domain-containing putative transcriptional regulator [Streptomyces sp. NPDC002588]|uniref:AfsR/SARP family transcriptional regulator n=1 Tax=Streptomyces sp. NPDC002588 TaxID=3154419 RepID=UPI00331A4B99